MRYDAVIDFVSASGYTVDAIGQQIPTTTTRRVYANEFSLSSSEFYDAGAQGLKPERQYQVRTADYAGETRALVDSVEYNIIRTERRGEWTRIIMQRVLGNG